MISLKNIISFICAILVGVFSSCTDEKLDSPWSNDYPEGETLVKMNLDFIPFSETGVTTRSLPGKTMDQLDDFCLVAYDREGNLLEGFPKQISDMVIKDQNRKDSDASNGFSAETSTKHGEFSLKLPFGQYYLYGVANLGKRDSDGKLLLSTCDALTQEGSDLAEAVSTREGLLNYQTEWDEENPYNNFEMLGFFCNGKDSNSPSTGESTNNRTVKVNAPGITLHCWLRRCVSKVTIDFDGSGLRENIYVYIKKATIHDIPKKCRLGMPNKPSDRDKDLYSFKNENYRPVDDSHVIEYSSGEDYHNWKHVASGSPFITDENNQPIDFHEENANSLFLYENMQGDSEDEKNKEQHPADNGTVSGATDEKDKMYCGSYIEVEGYYEYISSNQVDKGKIIYRFMLGKDALKNFDVERNHHIKLTMKFRGNGNDVDWHIEYRNDNGFEVKDPYYVSYVYNHDSTIHFRYTPPEGFEVETLTAEIVGNNWWPDSKDYALTSSITEQSPFATSEDETNWKAYNFNHNKYTEGDLKDKTKFLGNGFLSLRETSELNINGSDIYDNFSDWGKEESGKYMNDNYFYGVKAPDGKRKIDRSKRTYYFDGSSPEDDNNKGREAYTVEKSVNGSLRFSIPVFTREKNMVKETAYSGNNPYEGDTRTAYVRLTATISNGTKKENRSEIIRVVQVPRLTNPKGIYRKSNNNENFHVQLLERESAVSKIFKPFKSDGPWMAEVIGDANFINLNGRTAIKGNTDSYVDFNIMFNKMNRDDKVRNAIIRVRYHNYTCVHLIFVRQGYGALGISNDNTKWHTTNLIYDTDEANDPRDEGSLFKFGNITQPIDVKSNAPFDAMGNHFTVPDNLFIAQSGGVEPKSNQVSTWKNVSGTMSPNESWSNSKIATMDQIKEIFSTEHVSHGYGVLYADGASSVKTTTDDAFEYYRHDGDKTKGMRGVFVYYWNPEEVSNYNCRNVFFPIGRSGFGHRRSWDDGTPEIKDSGVKNNNHTNKGVLRYSAGRSGEMPKTASPWMPIFFDLYRREGAVYWAIKPKTILGVTGASVENAAALDLNYYTFDVNCLPLTNLQKHKQWEGCEDSECINACFLRLVN